MVNGGKYMLTTMVEVDIPMFQCKRVTSRHPEQFTVLRHPERSEGSLLVLDSSGLCPLK